MAVLEIRLLGSFEVRLLGRPVAVNSPKQRALLATLAMSAGRSVTPEVLAEQVWRNRLPARVRPSLQTLVARIRRLLGDDSLLTTTTGYLLAVDPDRVDAQRFLRLVSAADGASDAAVERATLRAALDEWRGDPVLPSPHLVERYLWALERRIDLDLEAADVAVIATELAELVERYPLREPLWIRLIRVYVSMGRTEDALAAYAACRRVLADELGTTPSATLRALHARLLVEIETTTSAPAVRPRQLPLSIARFTGRFTELATLTEVLTARGQGSTAVAVIDGLAGAGKTSLAIHWASRHRHAFDVELFINLRGHAETRPVTAAEALDTLLRSMGIPARTIPSEVHRKSELLRDLCADARTLLVLDNAADADQVRPLLPGPGAMVVVTSRAQLGDLATGDGAVRVPLAELDRAEAVDLFTAAVGPDRVAADPAAAGELTDLCGRLPLAVALTAERAARLADVPLAELADELAHQHNRLDSLSDPHDRRTDLRVAFSWSYQALNPEAARVFRLSALHLGSDFRHESAAAICDLSLDRAQEVLEKLVATSLLGHHRSTRYRFHDLVFEYANDLAHQVESPESEAATRRLVNWYLRTAGQARLRTHPDHLAVDVVDRLEPDERAIVFADGDDAHAWLEVEYDALVESVRVASDRGWHGEVWRLSYLLADMFVARYDHQTWVEVARKGMAAAEIVAQPRAFVVASIGLGMALDTAFRCDRSLVSYRHEALAIYTEALARCRAADDRQGTCDVLNNLGLHHYWNGAYDDAAHFHERAVVMAPIHQPSDTRAVVLANLADDYLKLGRLSDAAVIATEALAIAEGPFRTGHILVTLTETYFGLGHLDRAAEFADRSVPLLRQARHPRWLADALIARGHVLVANGDHDGALSEWFEALSIAGRHHLPRTAEIEKLLDSRLRDT